MPHDSILIPRREWLYSLFWYRGENESILILRREWGYSLFLYCNGNESIPYSNTAEGMTLFPVLILQREWVYSLWVISGIRHSASQGFIHFLNEGGFRCWGNYTHNECPTIAEWKRGTLSSRMKTLYCQYGFILLNEMRSITLGAILMVTVLLAWTCSIT